MNVAEDAEDFGARVESHNATQHAHRPLAVVMAQRSAEHRVLQGAGERAGRIELSLQIESGDESPDGADVDPAGFHGERLECQSRSADADFAFSLDLALGPSRNERVTERPPGLDFQSAHRAVDDRLTG